MGEILVGTSSWTDPTLIKDGHFYPPDASTAEGRLRHYASVFPLVEVDSTYYFPPSERNSVLWLERTPPSFTFNIKAYSLLTNHPTKPGSLYKDLRESLPEDQARKRTLYREHLPPSMVDEVWQRFHDALLPLHSAGKLGAVLFQFPPWFMCGKGSKTYIEECADRLDTFRIAIEFRHESWLSPEHRESTLAFLEEHRLPFVAVDMPQGFDSSVPPIPAVTDPDLAIVRFHGRNDRSWERNGITASERFRYHYELEELREWVAPVQQMSTQASETHVLFNNCYRDYAVDNARSFQAELGLEDLQG